jgi:hypothetical protein
VEYRSGWRRFEGVVRPPEAEYAAVIRAFRRAVRRASVICGARMVADLGANPVQIASSVGTMASSRHRQRYALQCEGKDQDRRSKLPTT